jgi:hypothetical protein
MTFKHVALTVLTLISIEMLFTACTSNPNKVQDIDTTMENSSAVNGDTQVGVKDGMMVVQKKVMMNEELRKLQYEVYELEDHVYGNRKYGSLGLYGVLRDCRMQLSDPKNGGDGKLKWTEPIDRVTDKEDEFKIGLDEENKLVGISEEFLADRIKRFKGYKDVLNKRQDEYEEKVAICKAELKSKQSTAQSAQ